MEWSKDIDLGLDFMLIKLKTYQMLGLHPPGHTDRYHMEEILGNPEYALTTFSWRMLGSMSMTVIMSSTEGQWSITDKKGSLGLRDLKRIHPL